MQHSKGWNFTLNMKAKTILVMKELIRYLCT